MSRAYGLFIRVRQYTSDRALAIRRMIHEEIGLTDWHERDGSMTVDGSCDLCGGETEKEAAKRITLAAWRANRAFCDVDLSFTWLENAPCTSYNLDEDDYEQLGWTESEGYLAPGDLDHQECITLLHKLRMIMYGEYANNGRFTHNPEKEWNGADVCQDVDSLLGVYKLRPPKLEETP